MLLMKTHVAGICFAELVDIVVINQDIQSPPLADMDATYQVVIVAAPTIVVVQTLIYAHQRLLCAQQLTHHRNGIVNKRKFYL